MRPQLGRLGDTPARQEARTDRAVRRVPRSRLIRRLAQARAARAATDAVRARSARRATGAARAGARGAARAGARGAARAAASPAGLIVATILVAGVVALRLGTGQPLEGTGADINRWLLGDADDKARAMTAARGEISGNPDVAAIAAQAGGITPQIERLVQGTYEMRLRDEKGRSRISEEFPVDGMLDHLILRAEAAFKSAWSASGGDAAVARLAANLQGIGQFYRSVMQALPHR